ncbi:MAG: hypothetical protein ACK4SX_08575 [Alcanivoracaceae bacterium]
MHYSWNGQNQMVGQTTWVYDADHFDHQGNVVAGQTPKKVSTVLYRPPTLAEVNDSNYAYNAGVRNESARERFFVRAAAQSCWAFLLLPQNRLQRVLQTLLITTAGRFLVVCRLVNGKPTNTTSPNSQAVVDGIVVVSPYLVECVLGGLRKILPQTLVLVPLLQKVDKVLHLGQPVG